MFGMDPVTSSLVSSIGGELLGGLFGSSSAKKQNKAAARQMVQQHEYNKEMMSNRHQWEVEDLKKAGLNPVLSAGSAPSMGGSTPTGVVGELDSLASSARSIGRIKEERELARATVDQVKLTNSKAVADTNLSEQLKDKAKAETRATNILADLDATYGPAQRIGSVLGSAGGSIAGIVGSAATMKRALAKPPVKQFGPKAISKTRYDKNGNIQSREETNYRSF